MSTTIDQKVVEMRFDNKQFESNVSTSMSTLEKLKQSLNLSGASKGLEDINAAARKVDISGLGNGVDSIQLKFSALQVMAVTALTNITNSAINAGKRIANALTLEPVLTGFQEYETQINAVQTILANTQHNGTTIDEVNEALDTLNKYADLTIYNFTEMTRNIGTFTAAGVDLQTSVDAIQGIANLAALSGSTSQQASTAMYQLSQALAAGRVSLMDWNSVVNAGMGGKVFQDALIRTSDLLKTGASEAVNTYGSFRESLTKGQWLTTEVLTETLKQFSGAYSEADLISQGFTESQAKEIMKLAQTATDAATKVKTFTQLWDVLKESAQSGWSQTWKLIIGDFEEAKDLLTPLADFLTGVINGISEVRNALLESALGKSFRSLADKIITVTEPIKKTVDTIKDLGSIVDKVVLGEFENSTDRINALTEAGYNYYEVQNKLNEKLGDSFRYTREQIDAQNKLLGVQTKTSDKTSEISDKTVELAQADKDLLMTLTAMSDEQLKSKGYTEEQIGAIRELRSQAEKLGIPLSEFINNLDEINGRWLLINSFKNIGQGLIAVINAIKDAWSEVFPPTTADQLFNIIAGFHKLTTYLRVSGETADKIKRAFKGLFAVLDIIHTIVIEVAKTAFGLLSKIIGGVNVDVLGMTASVGDMLVAFRDWILDNNLIVEGIQKVIDIIGAGIDIIRRWIKAFSEIPAVHKAIESIKTTFVNVFKSVKETINDFVNGIRNGTIAFDDLIAKFREIGSDIVDGLIEGMSNNSIVKSMIEFARKILDTVKDFLGIHSPSTKFIEVGENVIDGFIKGIQNAASAIWNVLKGIAEKCLEIFKNIDFGAVLTVGIGVGLFITANKITEVLEKFASPFENLGEMFEGIGTFFKDLGDGIKSNLKASALEKRSKALLNLAFAISVLAVSIALLTKLDTGKMWGAIGAITILAAVITGMSIAIGKFGTLKDTLNFNGFALAMIGIAAALLLITSAMKKVSGMNETELKQGVNAIAALSLILAGLIASTKLFNKDASKVGEALIKISFAILLMVGIIKLVSGMDAGELAKGFLVISAFSGLIVALVALTKLYNPNAVKIGSTLLGISRSLFLLIATAKLASSMDAGELVKGFIVVSAFSGLIVALVALTNLYNPNAVKIGSTLLGISASMLLMAITIRFVSGMDASGIAKGIITIAAFGGLLTGLVAMTRLATDKELARVGSTILAMSVSIGILAAVASLLGLVKTTHLAKGLIAVGLLTAMIVAIVKSTEHVQQCKSTLLMMSVAIGILAASIAGLSFIDPSKLAASTAAISVVLGMFALLMKSTKSLDGLKIAPLIMMTGIVALLAGIVIALSELNADSALDAAASISVLLLSMSASLTLISKTGQMAKSAIGSLVLMGLVVAELAVILGLMSYFDVNPSIEVAKSLSIMLLSMSVALVVLGAVGAMGPAAFIGIGALATLIAGIGGLIVAIGALATEFPKLETFLNNGIPVLEKIGYALGSFFGNIIGGFLGNLTSGIPEIGTHLSNFMTNLQPFLDGAKNIDPAIIDGVKALAETILILTAVDVINGLTSWFTGGSSITDFSKQLVPFGEAMRDFSAIISGNIDESAVTAAANAGKMLAEMAAMIPNSGGIAAFFAGDNSLTDFFTQLVPFGEAISAFSDKVSGKINEGAVEAAANAGKVMAEMASTIPNTGGIISFFAGDKDLATFGTQLVLFGDAVAAFSDKVSGKINEGAVEAAANAGKAMAEMASTIPNTGGVIAFFTGDKDLATFGTQLVLFGDAITDFSDKVSGNINEDSIIAAANAGKVMAELANSLPNAGGVISFFAGDKDLSTFGTSLASFGESFADYSDKIKDVNPDVVIATCNAAKSLVELQNRLPKEDGIFSDETTLKDFGKTISNFGEYLSDYYENISGIDSTKLSLAITQVNRLVSMFRGMVGLDTSGVTAFNSALTKLAKSGVDEFIKAFSDASSSVDKAVSNLLSSFINSINNNMILRFIETSLNIIAGCSERFFVYGANLMERLLSGADSRKVKMSNVFVTTINSALVFIKSRYNAFYQAGAYLVTGFANGISANAYKAKAQAIAMAKAAEAAAKSELGINSPSREFAEIGKYAVEGFVKGISTFSGYVSDSASAIATVATESLNNSIGGFIGLNQQFYSIGELLISKLIEGINVKGIDLPEIFKEVIKNAIIQIRKQRNEFYSAGKYLVLGFAAGITENTYIAVAKAKAMARAAANAAKKELDINSPSKVGYSIGDFFGIGFTNGIVANVAKSYSAGFDIAEAAKTGLSNAIAKVSDLIKNGIDSEPMIRPVLDLSEVESEATRLNAMLSRTQAMSISASMANKSNSEIQNGDNATKTTGNVYTFTQNNYSPKALSRLEIYRQTKNQFSAMKGLVET